MIKHKWIFLKDIIGWCSIVVVMWLGQTYHTGYWNIFIGFTIFYSIFSILMLFIIGVVSVSEHMDEDYYNPKEHTLSLKQLINKTSLKGAEILLDQEYLSLFGLLGITTWLVANGNSFLAINWVIITINNIILTQLTYKYFDLEKTK